MGYLTETLSCLIIIWSPLFYIITNLIVLFGRKRFPIRWKYKWISVLALLIWMPLGILFYLNPLCILVYPEFVDYTYHWDIIRSVSIVIYILSFILYLSLKRDLFYMASCAILIALTTDFFYCVFFGIYNGP
jgi:hypothetical protein